ncbi:MAG: pilus assembly protein PilM [Candidatus Riflebacteria bacterium]|nr:pilus assembly protein PilM [Candidatus Riflebacteria bacterium]
MWRLSQSLPTALQTGHSLAYQHVQTSPSEEARRFRLMVLVARGDLVEDLADILEDLGVEPLGFLPELLASVNTMAEQLESRPGLVSWIQMAASGTGLLLIDRGVPTFYRFTSWGVDQVIQRAAVHLGRSFEDVSATLQGGSLTRPTEVGGNEVAAVSDSIVPLLQEMQSTVQFHLRQAGRSDLTQVILSGGGAKLPGMESLLGSVLQAPCSTLDTLLVGLGLPQGDEGRYAACLGAVKALEGRAP